MEEKNNYWHSTNEPGFLFKRMRSIEQSQES